MTFPFNIHIGSLELSSHLVCELLAYSLGFRYFLYLRKKQGDTIESDYRTILFIAATAGALIGSRIIGYLDSNEFYAGDFSWTSLYTNKTILGGLFGGLISVELTKLKIGITTSSGDLMTYPLLFAMIVGRIGCFLAGLEDGTYGLASNLPWAIDFGDHVKRHPTNLYEIIFLSLAWISIYIMENKFTLSNGAKFKIFLASYFVFRFSVEFIKPIHTLSFGLSSIQLASFIGILYYYKVFIKPSHLIQK